MLSSTGAGKPDGSLVDHWADLGAAADLVAIAPDDEILGEMLALQVLLHVQAVANHPFHIPGLILHK